MGKQKIAIWGTGIWGDVAYSYYSKKCDVAFFVDSNDKKWGTCFNGIKICPPDILMEQGGEQIDVVIAVKSDVSKIKERLWKEYHIRNATWFQIAEYPCALGENECEIDENTVVVAFSGGLGNQMFQYAFFRNLELSGKHVLADFSRSQRAGYPEFSLTKVFPHIRLSGCSQEQRQELIALNAGEPTGRKKFVLYKEANIYETGQKEAEISLSDITGGYIQGWFQSYQFAENVREALQRDFTFNVVNKTDLRKLCEEIKKKNVVGVHIRRGDYLDKNNIWVYGDSCTPEYYQKAIQYMQSHVDDMVLCFFSNDIEWVKNEYKFENAIFISDEMFAEYEDWYDMYLMSMCKHNIIANSTFSWWGAWLNQNSDKIVIAPQKWLNYCDYKDICPHEWIRI